MDRWRGKVALVTGASSGIGKATALELASHGLTVIGCGRNVSALEAVSAQALEQSAGKVIPMKCDLENEDEILRLFQYVDEKFGAVHVLVNNAGLAHNSPLLTGTTQDWRQMLAVNVMAPAICSREAIKLMDKRAIDDGHIVNINSISGHAVDNRPKAHFYQMTKHAITAFTDGLRRELISKGSRIRVTSISPGNVQTDFLYRWHQNEPGRAAEIISGLVEMPASDIADMVVYTLSSPPTANICELLVKANGGY